jgi:hypothetical protein
MASLGERLRAAARPQRAGETRANRARAGLGERTAAPPTSAVVVPRTEAVDEAPWEAAEAVAPPAGGVASAAELRRERRELAERYEELQRDIGGLAIEMARQANFNYPLLRARSEEALRIEQRVAAIDGWLEAAAQGSRLARLRGGAAPLPALPPARAAGSPASCSRCGADVVADANFCAFCGATIAG